MAMNLKMELNGIEAQEASEVIRAVMDYLNHAFATCTTPEPKFSFTYEDKEDKESGIAHREESTPFSRYINSPTIPKGDSK